MFQPRRILHPTDFSQSSAQAFHVALDLAEQNQGTVLVVHVVETLGPERVSFGEAFSQLQPESHRARLEAELRLVAAPAGSSVQVEHLLAEGDPAGEIDRVAQEHQCDLIVMSTHGRTGLRRLLMGSVAEQVLRHTPCPVLILRAPHS